jgi:multidrug efflux system membrane fusion protein
MKNLIIIITFLTGVTLLASCGSDKVPVQKKIRPVKSLIIGDIGDATGKGFPGVTQETKESEMSFRVGGPIVKLNVIEGARVDKGVLIAEIDSRDYRVVVQSTKARYDQTKAESDRFYRLWQKGSVAKNDYERRFANFLEAEAAWVDAKNALSDTKMYAPYTGFYGPKQADLGEEVRPKQAITTLVDLSVVEINTTIPEQLAIHLLNFEKYEVRLETYPDIVFGATLKELEKKPTAEGYPLHLFLDHKNIPDNDTQVKVSAGMSCRVNIILKTSEDSKERIIIPITAVFEGEMDDEPSVWIIDPNTNTVQKQKVMIGDIVGNDAIHIMEGLVNGQQIVVAGVHRLTEGDEVNILESH